MIEIDKETKMIQSKRIETDIGLSDMEIQRQEIKLVKS